MFSFFGEETTLTIIFAALIGIIALVLVLFIAYLILRSAVRWGIDHSATAQAYRRITEYELKEKYKEEEDKAWEATEASEDEETQDK